MIVCAILRLRDECDEEVRQFIPAEGVAITIGNEYEVHCVSFFNDLLEYQIVDDLGYPTWCPHVLFNVTDRRLPTDWQINCSTNDRRVSFAIGPEFVVQNEASIQAMIELDADQVDRFWRRLDSFSDH